MEEWSDMARVVRLSPDELIGGQLRDVAQIVEETDQQIAGKMGFQ
ncbi:hypothetical protein [Paenilisteria weihenstephanensis]|nr:hypothetical protein [Listeria weihenstephanensis]